MAIYRSFPLDLRGRISEVPAEFEAVDDAEAIGEARRRIPVESIELWRGTYRIVVIETSR